MKIQPLGFFFPQNAAGELLNPTGIDCIPQHWLPLIEEVGRQYQQHLGESLHSIWLRGSVARGTAVDGISDLDTFALIYSDERIRWQEASWSIEVAKNLQSRFPFVEKVEFQLNSYLDPMEEAFPMVSAIIALHSLCWWGKDIRPQLPKYQPGRQLCFYYRWLKPDLADFLKKDTFTTEDCRQLMKTVIRCGFELVMQQQQRYTLDLFCCVQAFSEHYVEKSGDMQLALQFYLKPPDDSSLLRKFVENFGAWLQYEVADYFENSSR